MKRNLFSVLAAVLMTAFASCEKEEYFTINQISDQDQNVEISKVFYSYSPISTKSTKSGQDGEKTGEVNNGDSLFFEVPGNVMFYTKPADTTCNWTIGSISHVGKDQIMHNFSIIGQYDASVVGENTNLRNFVVVIGTEEGGNDQDSTYTIPYNIILNKKEDVGNSWRLTFHVRNQYPGNSISSYGHVGSGYVNYPGWSNPAFNNISFYSTDNQEVLVYTMNVAKNYVGKIKFCLTMGNNYFSPNLNGLGGQFFNTDTPGDEVWQFNINGANGTITSWNGANISTETGQTGNPGKINDGFIGFTINNSAGGDESLTIFVKSTANELRFFSSDTSSSGIPSETTMSTSILYETTGYTGWKSTNIPRSSINKYLWFHFGINASGNYTRSIECDNSNLFVQAQSAFLLMN